MALLQVPDGLELVTDPSVADWIMERLWPWGPGSSEGDRVRIGSFLPEVYQTYSRIFHPAYRAQGDVGTMRWSALAERRGLTLGPELGFTEVSGLDPGDTQAWQDAVPLQGSLPRDQLRALARILESNTSTPDDCWFCLWEGFGFWGGRVEYGRSSEDSLAQREAARRRAVAGAERETRVLDRIPRVHGRHRAYFLFQGSLSRLPSFEFGPWYQSPNLWWPDDRAWCAASEVDSYSSYVGGSGECIAAVLGSPHLEGIEVDLQVQLDPP
ncbi:MAG TPA: hypothetical protein VF986_04485 [Actinomycetota bacterium]